MQTDTPRAVSPIPKTYGRQGGRAIKLSPCVILNVWVQNHVQSTDLSYGFPTILFPAQSGFCAKSCEALDKKVGVD